ncbi:hypothetical protein Tco_0143548 [Tanacetum coccineum]
MYLPPRGFENLQKMKKQSMNSPGAELEHSKPGLRLQGAKIVDTGSEIETLPVFVRLRVTTPRLRFSASLLPFYWDICTKPRLEDVEKLVDVVYKLGSSFGEVFGIGDSVWRQRDVEGVWDEEAGDSSGRDSAIDVESSGLKGVTCVRRPSSRGSSSKNSVLSNTKNQSEDVEVHIVANVDVKNALKAKDVLCVSCDKNVLTPCHDKCLAKYKLYVHSKVRRALFTTHRNAKSKSLGTTLVVAKTSVTAKPRPSVVKSIDNVVAYSDTPVPIRKWVAKPSTIPSVFSSCDEGNPDRTVDS